MKGLVLRDTRGAKRWGEAYPVGNGHLGAMIYGDVPCNQIDLSENTFYSGMKECKRKSDEGLAFFRMREAAKEEAYQKVHEIAEEFIGTRGNYGTNLPVGKLYLRYGRENQTVQLIERSLSIMDGIAKRKLHIAETEVTESIAASHPDHMLVVSIGGTRQFSCHINLELETEGEIRCQKNSKTGQILFTSSAYERIHCDQYVGVKLQGICKVVSDGEIHIKGNQFYVENSKKIFIFLKMETDFMRRMGWETVYSSHFGFSKELSIWERSEVSKQEIYSSCDFYTKELINRHQKDVQENMERSTLVLSGEDQEKLNQVNFLYQYGRYLLLSSSREDSILPAHLQGIWNDNVACRIGWTCDMHLDINTQMNYWPAEVTGLSETTAPLFHWIRSALYPAGQITAKYCYGLDGWVAEIVSNAWGYTMPYWASPIAPCPTGGIWILTHMWEHYIYTRNFDFLLEKAFPIIEESALFFRHYVFETKEGISCGPSISPENSFEKDGKYYQISNGCTYEIVMIRELFSIYLNACRELEKEDIILKNKVLRENVESLYHRLLPYKITKQGTIAEYDHILNVPDKQHRHTSHLLGLFPFSQITVEETPELCTAAEKTIMQKITPIKNWEDTGWASAMLMLYEARLMHGNLAFIHMQRVIDHLLEPNKMVYHPPTRGAGAFDHVYELDGNTGVTTCIAEMLLQSHNNLIKVLPALPDAWENGEVTGLHARGNLVMDFKWENKTLQYLKCQAMSDIECSLQLNGSIQSLKLKEQEIFIWRA